MAAVENLSEVIKDSDKEHVSTSRKEISSENAKLINGEAEIERSVENCSKSVDPGENDLHENACKQDDVTDAKQSSKLQERSLGVSVICKSFSEKQESTADVDGIEPEDMEVENSKGLDEGISGKDEGRKENCENGEEIGDNGCVKREHFDDVSNGDVKSEVLKDNKIQNSISRDEFMAVDGIKTEDDKKESLSGVDDAVVAKDEQNCDEKVGSISQDSLLKKLGFSAVKQLALGKLHQAKNENIDVSNYEGNVSSKIALKSKESVLDKIFESELNSSSRSNSPATLVNGDAESHKVKRLCEQRTLIGNLKEDLRTEEAKLLLLRKVFDSQSSRKNGSMPMHKMKENGSRHVNLPSLHPKSRLSGQSYSSSPSEGGSSIQIAPKVIVGAKGSSSGSSNLPRIVPSIVPSTASSSNGDSPRVTYASVQGSGSSSSSQVHHKYYIQVGNQLVPAAPPTCINQPVYAMPSYTSASSVSAKSTSSVNTTGTVPSAKAKSQINADSQASKHSAAKAALRRQLEQTLLQIPPPRPPSADWRVIPNVNSMDFMMLVGLDEIVDMILENDGKPTLKNVLTETLPANPLICDQCGMDFSPNWKTKEGEKTGHVLCEKCSLTNTKKELKAEHTSRLKSAFMKALKQEQELEEKIKAGEDVSIASPPLENQSAPVAHHQPMHNVHKSYKHQKGPINSDHHHPVHHHHHQVVQHYPHHTSLVHQLHQQHMQQQQVDYDGPVGSSHRTARWHPYIPSHHHSSSHVHNVPHHRSYSGSSSRGSDSRHEYYVVHHPQHSTSSGRWGH